MKWVDQIGSYRVRRRESPRPGGQPYIGLGGGRAFVIHTTEGTSLEGAWSTLNSNGSAPHFLVGEGQIVQMRPLDAQAATLREHNDGVWQVECVMRVAGVKGVHQMRAGTWEPLVELTRFMHTRLGVPLRRPAGWRDDLSDISSTWASNNDRRQSRKALGFRGLLGHLEIPDQDPTWHYDPGRFDYTALIAAASGGAIEEGDDEMFEKWRAGFNAFLAGNPKDKDWPVEKKQGWDDAREVLAQARQTARDLVAEHGALTPHGGTVPSDEIPPHTHRATVELVTP